MARPKSIRIGVQQLALLHLIVLGVNGQENQTCSDAEVNAYIACVRDNPCLCSRCDSDPLDDDPVINVDEPPQSCQDVNRLFCPLIRCCSACEDEARAWYGCAFREFSAALLGESCPTTCSGFAFLDVEGDCEPSPSPTPLPTTVTPPPTAALGLCRNEVTALETCISDSSSACGDTQCAVDLKTLDPSSESACKAHDAIICPIIECCNNCEKETSSLSQCIQAEMQASNVECSLSCNSSAYPTTARPSPSKVSGPTAAASSIPTAALPPSPTANDPNAQESGCRSHNARVYEFVALGMIGLLSALV